MSYLSDWAKRLYRHKDVIAKKIKNISDTSDGFVIEYTDKEVIFSIAPDISTYFVDVVKKNIVVVTLNTEAVVPWLEKNWQKLIALPGMQFLVVNPFSKIDMKWQICPAIHHRIADDAVLKPGLLAMGELVDKISLQEFEGKSRGSGEKSP